MNCRVRFEFGGSTVLVACRGDQVSFDTTEGAWLCPLKGHSVKQTVFRQFPRLRCLLHLDGTS